MVSMKLNFLIANRKTIQTFRVTVMVLAIIALLAELLPEVEAKPIVIIALILTISFGLIGFIENKEKDT